MHILITKEIIVYKKFLRSSWHAISYDDVNSFGQTYNSTIHSPVRITSQLSSLSCSTKLSFVCWCVFAFTYANNSVMYAIQNTGPVLANDILLLISSSTTIHRHDAANTTFSDSFRLSRLDTVERYRFSIDQSMFESYKFSFIVRSIIFSSRLYRLYIDIVSPCSMSLCVL